MCIAILFKDKEFLFEIRIFLKNPKSHALYEGYI